MFRHESDSTAKKVEAREANTRKSKPKVKKQASSDKGKGKDKSPASTPAARTLSWVTATTSETGSTMTVASRRQKFNQSMSPLGSGTTYSLPSRAPSPISYSLGSGATLDERGICFFLQRFVIDMSGFTFSTLRTPLIGSAHMAAGDNSPLILSIKAVGLACLSNINSSGSPMPRLMTTTALQHYAAALRLVNDALRSPREAVKDSTLLTIMILGLWEQVTGRNNYSLSAWKNHVTGASALLKLRGRRQFKSPAGLQLFMQSSAMIMSSCVQHELNVPQHIIDLRAYASMFINTSDIGWRLNEITIKFANFRANLKNRHPSLSTPQQIIATCLEIDKEFEETFDLKTVPKEWRYETVYTGPEVDPRLVFAGYYHVYSNIRIARTWSAMRCSRFLLNGVISRLLGKGVSGHLLTELSTGMICQNFGFQVLDELEMEGGGLDQWTKSMEVLWKLQADIMAAVPQLVGYIPSPSGFAIASTDGGETDELLAYDPGSPPRAEALLATSNVRLSSPSVNPTDDEYNLISSSSRFTTYTDNIDPALISYPSSQHSPSSDSSPQNSRSSRSPTPSSAAALASAHNLPTLLVGCGGLFVLFPLYVIGVRGIASESLRTWIITCLKTIGRSQGLNQAIMLAGLLEKREQVFTTHLT